MRALVVGLACFGRGLECFALRWLQKIKLVPGDAGFKEWHPLNGNGKFSISWLAFGSAFGVLHHLSAHMREADDKKRAACRKNAFKVHATVSDFRIYALMCYHRLNVCSEGCDIAVGW